MLNIGSEDVRTKVGRLQISLDDEHDNGKAAVDMWCFGWWQPRPRTGFTADICTLAERGTKHKVPTDHGTRHLA